MLLLMKGLRDGFEAVINMDEYEYIKKIINVFVEHLWLLSFVKI